MRRLTLFAFILSATCLRAQVGVGTTSPNSTLDIRGSLSAAVNSFTAAITAGSADNMLLFIGNSATTLTLPTAVGVTGRVYWIKNSSSNSSVLSIATTSSQTIDGAASWSLTQAKAIRVISNGSNWFVAAESVPGNGTALILGGNSVASVQNIGTTSNYDLPFITNNTEKMRLTASGSLGIGTSAFSSTYPERLLVDAGSTGNTNYENVIVGKGNTNSYAQLNIQNSNAGTSVSSDVVATADNGSETVNFIDMGINSSANTQNYFGGLNDAYLFSIGNGVNTGGNLYIGTATASRDITFLTGGGTKSSGATMNNERMRILGTGDIGIANNSPTEKLDITGNLKFSGALMPGGIGGTAGYFLQSMGANNAPVWFDASSYAWILGGNATGAEKKLGSTDNYALPFITDNVERMRISNSGSVGIGANSFNGTFPEKLLVDAGASGNTNYQNVIVGKGNTNGYAQLNIQNINAGIGASSDVVATADNGDETHFYVNMGINSSVNTSGVMGGSNDAYLYNLGQNFLIGAGTPSKSLIFLAGGADSATNEKLRVTSNGITVTGSQTITYHSGAGAYTLLTTDYVVINTGVAATWTLPAASTCAGRIYRLLNQGTGSITLSQAVTTASATTTTTLANTAALNFFEILSDGTVWRRIN